MSGRTVGGPLLFIYFTGNYIRSIFATLLQFTKGLYYHLTMMWVQVKWVTDFAWKSVAQPCHWYKKKLRYYVHIFYSLLFFLFRQANLNEAAERQYERAASIRPDVSTWTGGPVSTYCGNVHTRLHCKFNLQHSTHYPSSWHYIIVLLFLASRDTAEYEMETLFCSCPWTATFMQTPKIPKFSDSVVWYWTSHTLE